MVGVREEVELSGIVGTFLRHASCRFNRDAPDLGAGPSAGRPRKVYPQFAQPAEIQRRADLGQVAAFDDDFVAVRLDRQQLGFAQRVLPPFELIHRIGDPAADQREAHHASRFAVGRYFAPVRGRRTRERLGSGKDFDAHAAFGVTDGVKRGAQRARHERRGDGFSVGAMPTISIASLRSAVRIMASRAAARSEV